MKIKTVMGNARKFNERLERIDKYTLFQRIDTADWGVDLKPEDGGFRSQMIGVLREHLDSVTVNFRFFYQPGDNISIINLLNSYIDLNKDSFLSDGIKNDMLTAYETIQDFLDADTIVIVGSHTIRHWEVLDIFMYGEHAHNNRGKDIMYDYWSDLKEFGMLEALFVYCIGEYLLRVEPITEINKRAFDELKGKEEVEANIIEKEAQKVIKKIDRVMDDSIRQLIATTPPVVPLHTEVATIQLPNGVVLMQNVQKFNNLVTNYPLSIFYPGLGNLR